MGERAKSCSWCKTSKPLDQFYKSSRDRTGRQSRCIPCVKERDSERPTRAWTDETKDKYLRRTYGISLADWNAMMTAQGGACAACGNMEPKRWTVDHDHDSGLVRGLLCDTCNRAIGLLKDSPDVLIAAAAYLLQHQDVLASVGGGSNG